MSQILGRLPQAQGPPESWMEPGPFVHSIPPEKEMLMRLGSPQSCPLDPETLGNSLEPASPLREVIQLIPPAFCQEGLPICLPEYSTPFFPHEGLT